MSADLASIFERTKSLWESYDALGQLVPIDDPAHHLLKRLNADMSQLYIDVLQFHFNVAGMPSAGVEDFDIVACSCSLAGMSSADIDQNSATS